MSSPGIITYPLGGITYDAEDAAAYFAGRTSGVYSTDIDFAVAAAADGNTDLTVSAGQAWMHVSRWVGLSVTMREAQTLTLPLADSALPRIDRVVLRYDATSRSTSLQVASPVLTINPACLSLTMAPPIENPLRPHCSIRVPAKLPSGRLKVLPALGISMGCLSFRRPIRSSIFSLISPLSPGRSLSFAERIMQLFFE